MGVVNGSRIARNFLALSAAQGVAMLTGLFTTAWLARALQPEAFGVVGFGAAFLSYFLIVVVFGTDRLAMREMARDPDGIPGLLPRLIGLRIALLFAAALAYFLVIEVIDQPDRVKNVMRIQALGLAAAAMSLDFVYQALERMHVIGLRQAASSVLVLAATLALIDGPEDVLIAAAIPHAVLICTAVWLGFRIQRDTKAIAVSFDFRAWGSLLRRSFPMAVILAMATVYLTIDILMLGFMDTAHAVGLYTGAARIYAIVGVLGGLLVAVFLPALSAAFGTADRMQAVYREFAFFMLFLALPAVAAAGCFPSELVRVVLGEGFLAVAVTLSVLMGAAGINLLNQINAASLLSWNREKAQMYTQGAGAALNVALNLVLIPHYGILGAAAASVVSELVACTVMVGLIGRGYAAALLRPVLGLGLCAGFAFGAVLAADALTGGALTPTSSAAGFAIKAGIACLLYGGAAWMTGLVDPARMWRLALRRDRPAA